MSFDKFEAQQKRMNELMHLYHDALMCSIETLHTIQANAGVISPKLLAEETLKEIDEMIKAVDLSPIQL